MSVLMKALEKAAQDRDKTPATAASAAAGRELSLEAMESGMGGAPPAAARYGTGRSSAQTTAATVLGVRGPASVSALGWLLARPLYAFGAIAGVFLLAYAAYVYVQIAHPGLLNGSSTQSVAVSGTPAVNTKPAVSPATAADVKAAPQAPAPDGTAAPLIPLQSVFGGRADTPTTPAAPAAAQSPKDVSAAIPPQTKPPAAQLPRAATPATQTPASLAPRNRIAISRGDNATPRVSPALNDAYAALVAGQYDTAQRLYSQVARSDPSNVDALLGLAALAQRDNRSEEAQRHYLAILDIEPRHALAQSGLIALNSNVDPQAAESRLKQLVAREPSPPLYFNLGNLYAAQGQWPQAQQAYFQAHSLDAQNPDYAYNLAVGLEHLGQQKLALGYYRKALQLASAKGAANFDPARIQERIAQLSPRYD
jgi:tetratricopeptide (TPR) repeat protein